LPGSSRYPRRQPTLIPTCEHPFSRTSENSRYAKFACNLLIRKDEMGSADSDHVGGLWTRSSPCSTRRGPSLDHGCSARLRDLAGPRVTVRPARELIRLLLWLVSMNKEVLWVYILFLLYVPYLGEDRLGEVPTWGPPVYQPLLPGLPVEVSSLTLKLMRVASR
jgi:hypothetical protein